MPRGVKGSGRPAYKSRSKRFAEAMEKVSSAKVEAEDAVATLEEDLDADVSFSGALEDAISEIEGLKDEIEAWRDGLQGTNLENSDKYQQLDECVSTLEDLQSRLEEINTEPGSPEEWQDVVDALNDIESEDVEFPTMYS